MNFRRVLVLGLILVGTMGGASADPDRIFNDDGGRYASADYSFTVETSDEVILTDYRWYPGGFEGSVKVEVVYNSNVVASKRIDSYPIGTTVNLSFSESDYSTIPSGDFKVNWINIDNVKDQRREQSVSFSGSFVSLTSQTIPENQFGNGKPVLEFKNNFNDPPSFNSVSASPSPLLIGETADFSYSASDPDGSISSVDLVLKDDGSTVFTGSKSTATGTFSPPDTLTEGDITATFTATDNKGATTTKTLTRTLTDTKPIVNISQPSGTVFDYDQNINVDTQIDGDNKANEQLSCVLELDSNQVDQRSVTEGDNYTVNERADLGSHNANVTCTEQDDQQIDSGSTSLTVENFQFQSLSGASTGKETTEQSFTAGFKAGDMVKIQLSKSSSTGPKTLQFETRDEINNSLLDANVEAGITVSNPDQPEKTRFFGFDFSKDKTHELFLSPSDATITANVFDKRSIAYENLDAGFPGRRHYLTDTKLDNETTNINLYLLEQTKGQTVRLELTNSDLQGLSNHLIRVERAFPDQNETRTVQLAKTGTEGFASTFLQLQERYIFTVFDENGDLVDQIGPETVTTTDKRIQVNDEIDPSLANVLNQVQFTDIQRGNQSLSVSYVSETQRLNNLFLKISSDGLFETKTLDVDSSEQPQGQLEVTDFNASEQRVFFELIGTFGETNLTLESGSFGQRTNTYGNAGLFVSFLMFTALTLSGLFRPSAAIGLGVISIFVMSFTGFLAVGQQALISIAALAAVLIWRMSSQ